MLITHKSPNWIHLSGAIKTVTCQLGYIVRLNVAGKEMANIQIWSPNTEITDQATYRF